MKNRRDEIQAMAALMAQFDCHDAHTECGRSHVQGGRSINEIDGRIENGNKNIDTKNVNGDVMIKIANTIAL